MDLMDMLVFIFREFCFFSSPVLDVVPPIFIFICHGNTDRLTMHVEIRKCWAAGWGTDSVPDMRVVE